MEADLHITDNQYLLALTYVSSNTKLANLLILPPSCSVFFFSYAIFEVPSNIFLKRLRPSIWLSLLMLLWGIMMVS